LAGIGLLVAGVGAMQVVLERGDKEGWFESRYITFLSIVAVVGAVGSSGANWCTSIRS